MSPEPEQAMDSADRLGQLARDAGHIHHMPGHIYVLCGEYKRAKAASEKAIAADKKYLEYAGPYNYYTTSRCHNLHLMMYTCMHLGQFEAALSAADGICKNLTPDIINLKKIYREEVIGAFAAAKSVLPQMIEQNAGSIFFSSATAAVRGSADFPLYAIGKFGLRALSQSLAKAYARHGIHIAHFRLDCNLDVPVMEKLYGAEYDPEKLADPDGIAESYWLTFKQPKSAWSNEVELRPHTERWTY